MEHFVGSNPRWNDRRVAVEEKTEKKWLDGVDKIRCSTAARR